MRELSVEKFKCDGHKLIWNVCLYTCVYVCMRAFQLRKGRDGMVDGIVSDGDRGIAHGERCIIII